MTFLRRSCLLLLLTARYATAAEAGAISQGALTCESGGPPRWAWSSEAQIFPCNTDTGGRCVTTKCLEISGKDGFFSEFGSFRDATMCSIVCDGTAEIGLCYYKPETSFWYRYHGTCGVGYEAVSLITNLQATQFTMEVVPFEKTIISYPGGEEEIDLFATGIANVEDLKAHVGSDTVRLKDRESSYDLGVSLDGRVVLRDIEELETKILDVIKSNSTWQRPGDPSQVDIVSKETRRNRRHLRKPQNAPVWEEGSALNVNIDGESVVILNAKLET